MVSTAFIVVAVRCGSRVDMLRKDADVADARRESERHDQKREKSPAAHQVGAYVGGRDDVNLGVPSCRYAGKILWCAGGLARRHGLQAAASADHVDRVLESAPANKAMGQFIGVRRQAEVIEGIPDRKSVV